MKLAQTKGLVLPAIGVATGMVASPKIQNISPFLSKHPYITPIILVLLALALMKYAKARPFALGLGAIAVVFLAMSIWNKVKGVTTGAPAETKEPWTLEGITSWIKKVSPTDKEFGAYPF